MQFVDSIAPGEPPASPTKIVRAWLDGPAPSAVASAPEQQAVPAADAAQTAAAPAADAGASTPADVPAQSPAEVTPVPVAEPESTTPGA
jgi:peptidylprolyl isomerase